MAPASSDGTTGSSPADIPIRQVIGDELSAVRKKRSELMTEVVQSHIHIGVLILCIGINLLYFLYRPDYSALFIAASFYLNMYYFVILLIPQKVKKNTGLQNINLSRFKSWLKEIGLASGTSRFTRLLMNSIFINSRTLCLGISLIFIIDILFAIRAHTTLELPSGTTVIVISQCMVIVIFYFLIWKVEPFSTTYMQSVEQVKRRLIHEKVPPRFITVLFVIGFLITLMLFLTTIILLPGITLNAFLDQSELTELGNLFGLLAILAISQYFLIRYIHGITSRTMAERVFDFKERSLMRILENVKALPAGLADAAGYRREISSLLLECRIFIVKRKTIAGFFPVFVVDLDFSVMLDSTTLTAIKGYIVEKTGS